MSLAHIYRSREVKRPPALLFTLFALPHQFMPSQTAFTSRIPTGLNAQRRIGVGILKILLFLRRDQTGSSHPDSPPAAGPVSWFTTCWCLKYRPAVSQRTIWLRCLLRSWPTPVCAGVAPLAKPHCSSNNPPTPPPPPCTHTCTLFDRALPFFFVATKTQTERCRTISAHSSVFSHRNGSEQKIVGDSSPRPSPSPPSPPCIAAQRLQSVSTPR